MYILVMGDENNLDEQVISHSTIENAISIHKKLCDGTPEYSKTPAYIIDSDDNICAVYPGIKEEKLIYAMHKMLLRQGEWL
jgi:hypothetical protein